jgi:peptidoglycan endopeptidase LytE
VARLCRLIVTVALVVAAAVLAPAVAHGDSEGHVVKPGDSLVGIAARYDVTLNSLLAVNHFTVTSLIVPGQRVAIPTSTTANGSSTVSGGSGHTVQSGDTLVGIAARYHVTLNSLLAVNHFTVTSLIVPGQRVTLPAGAVAPSATATTGSAIDRVLTYARAQLGKPYRFFAAGPDAFDCSGLTLAAYAQIGVTLVHYSAFQAWQGSAVDFTQEAIRPGDLVFMDTDDDGIINHVGIAIDSTTWIQAARPGDVVRMGPMPPKSMIAAVRRYASNN